MTYDTFADALLAEADAFGLISYETAIKALHAHGLREYDLICDRDSLWELMIQDELPAEELLDWLGY